ncbi:hypothetical protein FSP39_016543 [Pinctada imbricata]|uniref:Uncharacterized protein n=1 Tax=Pinctada imbricata TaxID=66713 RepID=A0AA88XRJ8_PINIB|nr:hypothetical protein FSP39_016543 [Pinctada imbricata]
MLMEAWRTKHPTGKLVQITDEDPDLRQFLLEKVLGNFDVVKSSWKTVSESPEYFMYTVESAV